MDDIIELFTDFEKKFLKLIKHLLVNPKSVLENLINKEKAYTKPFKFYSVISTITLFFILLSNRFDLLAIWNDDPVLPQYWVDYAKNLDELKLTLLPILGFLFCIFLLGVFSFFLFRNPKTKISIHFSYAMYIDGMMILYLDVIIPFAFVWINYISFNTFSDIMINVLVFGGPLFYLVRAYWVWDGKKIIKFVKILLLAVGTAFVYFQVYIEGDLEEMINDKLFYRKEGVGQIVSDVVPTDAPLVPRTSWTSYFRYKSYFDLNPLVTDVSYVGDSLIIKRLDDQGLVFQGIIEEPGIINLTLFNYHASGSHAIAESGKLDSPTPTHNLWKVDENESKLIASDSLLFNEFSVMVPANNRLLLTGQTKNKQGAIYQILDDDISELYSLSQSATHIDDILPVSLDGNKLFFLSNKVNDNSLESVTIHYLDLEDSTAINQTRVFHNTFASIPTYYSNYCRTKIYNPKIVLNSDSSAVHVIFQIMTERTFSLQLFTIDRNLKVINQTNYTTDYHVTYFDDYKLVDDVLFVVGRIFSIVPKDISFFGMNDGHVGRSFIAKFDDELQLSQMKIIDKKGWFDDFSLYVPDIHLEVDQDSIQVLTISASVDEWRIAKF